MARSDLEQYRNAIASIESQGSGDYAAVGPTHPELGRALGRYQVMEANIAPWTKAALGRSVSSDEFLANPEIQDAVFDHQFGGYVDKFGPEGAAQAWFAGPGGVGKLGRRDSLDTSVADYTNKFNTALAGGGSMRQPSQLATMATESDERATSYADTAARLGELILGGIGSSNVQGKAGTDQPPRQGMSLPIDPRQVNAPAGGSKQPFGFGSTVDTQGRSLPPGMVPSIGRQTPFSYNGLTPPGMPAPLNSGQRMQLPQPNEVTPAPTTSGPRRVVPPGATGDYAVDTNEEAASDDPGFLDRVSEKLFPKADDPRGKMSELMGALGVGLGQMSSGKTVDLQSYFANIADQRQAVIDSQRTAVLDANKAQVSAMNADTARMQANIAHDRLQFDIQTEEDKRTSAGLPVFTPEQLEQFSLDPQLSPFVSMLALGDKEASKQAVQGIRQVLVDRAKGDKEAAGSGWGELLDAVNNDASPNEVGAIMDRYDMGQEDLSAAYTNLGKRPTAFAKDMDAYIDADEPTRQLMEKRWRNMVGVEETPQQEHYRTNAFAALKEYDDQVAALAPINNELHNMRNISLRMMEEGQESGPLNELAGTLYRSVKQTTGVGLETFVSAELISNYDQLNNSEKTLALMIAKPMMEGGGAISDAERQSMLDMVAKGDLQHGTRLQIIEKLMLEQELLKKVADDYGTYLGSVPEGEDYSGAYAYKRKLDRLAQESYTEILRAAQGTVAVTYKGRDEFASYRDMTEEQIIMESAPLLTQDQYDLFKDVIKRTPNGNHTWRRINKDGSTSTFIVTADGRTVEYGDD